MSAVTADEFERALERHDLTAQVWGLTDEDVERLDPNEEVAITVWDGEEVVHECIVRAEAVWRTMDFIIILMDGGVMPWAS